MSGLEFFEKMRDGALPHAPIMELLAFSVETVAIGRITFIAHPDARFYNPIGTIHGGWAATLLDSCVGCAVHSTLEPGESYTTLELKVNYTRAIQSDTGALRAIGEVVHAGRRTATATGELRDEAGRLYAHASTTCLLLRPA